jgi:hypothetical protein
VFILLNHAQTGGKSGQGISWSGMPDFQVAADPCGAGGDPGAIGAHCQTQKLPRVIPKGQNFQARPAVPKFHRLVVAAGDDVFPSGL